MDEYLAICSRQPGNELIAAECENLTGGKPESDGVAICQRIDLIPRAAFVQRGLRLIARAETLEALVTILKEQAFPAENFRIELMRTSRAHLPSRQETILAIANALKTYPNLEAPRHRFLLLERAEGLYFGEILSESQHDYQQHMHKPFHTSSALPAQLARGMVNLASPPARSILDPCCGTGSILLEALALGLETYGYDYNWRMVNMARGNLAHFGYKCLIQHGDARQIQQFAEAVVTDLPYGHMQMMDVHMARAILARCVSLAPLGIFAAGADISSWLEEAGYTEIEVFRVKKRSQFARYIHRGRVKPYVRPVNLDF